MSEIQPFDMSKCFFCKKLIFPIVNRIQKDLHDHDSTRFWDDKHHRFHIKCLTKRQKLRAKQNQENVKNE